MQAWLFHRDKHPKRELRKVMPGVQWLRWETKFLKAGIRSHIAAQIDEFLDTLGATRGGSRYSR